MNGITRGLCALVAFALAGLPARVDAMGVVTLVGEFALDIQIEEITGEVGYLSGSGGTGGEGEQSVYGMYGYECSGKACAGADSASEHNILAVTWHWMPGDNSSWTATGQVFCGEKDARQNTVDWDCPEGPPTWSATATVVASVPSLDGDGGESQAGSIAQSYSHSTSPNTTWSLGHWKRPIPPGYGAEQSTMDSWSWSVNPEDPDTWVTDVSAKVTSTFSGSAKEIQVIISYLKMKVTLVSSCT